MVETSPVHLQCSDGYTLHGDIWLPANSAKSACKVTVLIAGATGVKATYYHRYAAYLAGQGIAALTFDYRGIGSSRPAAGTSLKVRWHQWGTEDIDAALRWIWTRYPASKVFVVGHSFGGFGAKLAASSAQIHGLLAVGAQHAYWGDYRKGHRLSFWWKWHLVMPFITALAGHFPGRRLGWLEDLPRGVALDWALGSADFTSRLGPAKHEAEKALRSFSAPTLAIHAADDPFATPEAVQRALNYSPNSPAQRIEIHPSDYGVQEIGHFAPFHSRFRDTFWPSTVTWLLHGDFTHPTAKAAPSPVPAARRTPPPTTPRRNESS